EAPAADVHDRYADRFADFHDDAPADDVAPRRRLPVGRWIVRGLGALIVLFVIAVGWLAFTAPLSKSLQPPTPPSITLTADD
ncbi:hypothetical protein, partial [Enterococcus faecium]